MHVRSCDCRSAFRQPVCVSLNIDTCSVLPAAVQKTLTGLLQRSHVHAHISVKYAVSRRVLQAMKIKLWGPLTALSWSHRGCSAGRSGCYGKAVEFSSYRSSTDPHRDENPHANLLTSRVGASVWLHKHATGFSISFACTGYEAA
jgi:hypothetical protein